ncbi:MAG: hypothetical protein A2Y79_03025 [Deltaproteobacteria bacterium RBG_13_43_22]|nr:MAG: hypothetical protein A2Y79_03025 [Deltaproteobacteria bacterium RBG_13_43_22]
MHSSPFRTFPFLIRTLLILLAGPLQAQSTKTVSEIYPYLATYSLSSAVLRKLKPGILVVSEM